MATHDLNLIAHFEVPGNPIALKRHRMTKAGISYDPSENDKKDFLAKCIQHKPEIPAKGPVEVSLYFYFQRPNKHYRTGKFSGELRDDAPELHSSRPDLDNLIKFVVDSIQGIFFYDDKQICNINALKCYDEKPRIVVSLYSLNKIERSKNGQNQERSNQGNLF